ncbi:hypothetical protein TPAU25S_00012 [Tsukamurella paurometabola]|uniref:DUF1684 domain-containing protein n=1 Tax=Tsukamurella paurometabola (strain ATCC 8368 / DSM 20162 / CCUG 35730 / CIP 100753 / JCM 10117 / KCTC 9821 / NBRC 16120 / NCIMB 702349 / NCTC 13040) TaxID=521096 RepID=D5UQY0_TSUPD|nr:DUF1684 domain-containing protein [Tsukamurella paurometabola]ADG78969.1 protein of unknown function DUF1684 [Tsukamurella paurometabola DSM 20162]SUP33648.1 Protein of uncharacterised function (DUF1684) [Tsukamurella paurometabola]
MTATTSAFTDTWNAWHSRRERELAAPLGWLAIARLEWLSTQPQRFDGIPGTWHHDGVAAYVSAAPGEDIDVDGSRRFESGATAPGHLIGAGGRQIEVAHRGDGYLIRVHDPHAPAVRAFRGVPAYEPDPDWVLQARFEPYDTPREVTVGAVAEGLEHVYVSPGEIIVDHDGTRTRLIAFNGKVDGLSVLFTDETSGVTTYAANRSLAVEAAPSVLAAGGDVLLDFNRAVNLPCAFIDFATCPLPPAGNRLPFAVTAGEKIPYERA